MSSSTPAYLGERTFLSPEASDAFATVLARLESVIDEETAMLRSHRHDRLPEHTQRKRQGFLEMNRLMRSLDNTIPSQDLIGRLAAFRRKLAANDAALQVEIRAAQAVTSTIVAVMKENESDGTYSRGCGRFDEFE